MEESLLFRQSDGCLEKGLAVDCEYFSDVNFFRKAEFTLDIKVEQGQIAPRSHHK